MITQYSKLLQETVSRFSVGEKLLAFVGTSYVAVEFEELLNRLMILIKIEELSPGAFDLTSRTTYKRCWLLVMLPQ